MTLAEAIVRMSDEVQKLRRDKAELWRFLWGSRAYFTCSPDGRYAVNELLERTRETQQADTSAGRTAGETD